MRFACLVAACLGLNSGVPLREGDAAFSSSIDLVTLQVTVTDRHGNFVDGLPEASFVLLENGVPQTLAFFRQQDAPGTVGLLIDGSGSMVEHRARLVEAVSGFAEESHPGDEFFVMAFSDGPRRAMPPGVRFTSDPSVLRTAVATGLGTGGRTALYDAVAAGLDEVALGHHERQVLVVVSDGLDNASQATLASALQRARASQVVVYTIAIANPLPDSAEPKILKRFAEATGGRFYAPSSFARVTTALHDVNEDIRHAYTLAYVSSNGEQHGEMRRIQLRVTARDGGRLTARTRSGYVAPAETHDQETVR